MDICGKVRRGLPGKRGRGAAFRAQDRRAGTESTYDRRAAAEGEGAGEHTGAATARFSQRACSACAGEYEDPERTAPAPEEELGEFASGEEE